MMASSLRSRFKRGLYDYQEEEKQNESKHGTRRYTGASSKLYEPCPRLRTLSLRNVGVGVRGAAALNQALHDGALSELRDLSLTGNRIGDESIRVFEVTTRSRPLIRITASRTEPFTHSFYLISLLLLWPFLTTTLIVVSLSMRQSSEHSTAILFLRSQFYQRPQNVYRSVADVIEMNQAHHEKRNTSFQLLPPYLLTFPLRKPKFLEQYTRAGAATSALELAHTICPQIRDFVERGRQVDDSINITSSSSSSSQGGPSTQPSNTGSKKKETVPDLWIRLLVGWPEFINVCLAKPPLENHGASMLAAGLLSQGKNGMQIQVLHSIQLIGQQIGPRGIMALANTFKAAPYLSLHLKTLDLSGNQVDLPSLTALMEGISAASGGCFLRHLHLDHTGLGLLAAEPIVNAMTSIGNSRCQMQKQGGLLTLSLREAWDKKSHQARDLSTSSTKVSPSKSIDTLADWFAHRGGCQSLTTLNLSGNRFLLGDDGLAKLLQAMEVGLCFSLTSLDLSYTGLTEASTSLLADYMKKGSLGPLKTLNLAGNRLYFRGAQTILHAAINPKASSCSPSLEDLDLTAIDQSSTSFPSIEELDLSCTGIRHWALRCSALKPDQLLFSPILDKPSSIKVLRLRGNTLGRCDVASLSRAFGVGGALSNLRELDVSDCGLSDSALKAMIDALESPLGHQEGRGVAALSSTCLATITTGTTKEALDRLPVHEHGRQQRQQEDHEGRGVAASSSTRLATMMTTREKKGEGGRLAIVHNITTLHSDHHQQQGQGENACQVGVDDNGDGDWKHKDASTNSGHISNDKVMIMKQQKCHQAIDRPALQTLRLGSNHFNPKVVMSLLKALSRPTSTLPSLTELDLSWSLTGLSGPLDFTASLTGSESSSISSRLPIVRPNIRRLALAGACSCSSLKLIDLRTGDESNHARSYRVDRIMMATPTLLPTNCALPCLRNVNVILSTTA